MTIKTKLKWRLGRLPESSEVATLLRDGILTKEEAREILFSLETDEDRDKQSLQKEIEFLRELVQRLANNQQTKIVETIRYIEKPYVSQPWYHPYYVYSSTGNQLYATTGTSITNAVGGAQSSLTNSTNTSSNSAQMILSNASNSPSGLSVTYSGTPPAFTSIKTF